MFAQEFLQRDLFYIYKKNEWNLNNVFEVFNLGMI